MPYKIMMLDLVEGFNSVLLLKCLPDMIHLSSKTERVSLVDEMDTRYIGGSPKEPQERLMGKLNFELINVFETNTGRVCSPELLPHLKSDFIFLQEFLYSAIPKFDQFDVRQVDIHPRIIYVDGDRRSSNDYTFS